LGIMETIPSLVEPETILEVWAETWPANAANRMHKVSENRILVQFG